MAIEKNEAAAHDTLEKVREHGVNGFVTQADMMDPSDIKEMLQRVRNEFGTLEIFVDHCFAAWGRFTVWREKKLDGCSKCSAHYYWPLRPREARWLSSRAT